MAQDSLYVDRGSGDEIKKNFEYRGINFIYRVPRDKKYVLMDRPVHSFRCPKCNCSMKYRRFGRYRCENPECDYKAKVKIWGEWKLYDFIRRYIGANVER